MVLFSGKYNTQKCNFAPAPRKIPVSQIVVAVENGLCHISDDKAANIRQRVTGLIKRARPPPSNITSEERKALSELKNDPHIMLYHPTKVEQL